MILSQRYVVKVHDQIVHAEHGVCNGLTDTDMGTIDLSRDQSETKQVETFTHELLHACLGVGRMSPRGQAQETFVTTFAPILLHVLRSNPKAVEYMLDRAVGGKGSSW